MFEPLRLYCTYFQGTAPTFTNLPKTVPDIGVSQTVGSTVYTLTADDKNSDDVPDLTMSLVGTPDYFDLNPATGMSTLVISVNKYKYSGTWAQRRPRSACASTQSDQGLHCPLTDSLDTTE